MGIERGQISCRLSMTHAFRLLFTGLKNCFLQFFSMYLVMPAPLPRIWQGLKSKLLIKSLFSLRGHKADRGKSAVRGTAVNMLQQPLHNAFSDPLALIFRKNSHVLNVPVHSAVSDQPSPWPLRFLRRRRLYHRARCEERPWPASAAWPFGRLRCAGG